MFINFPIKPLFIPWAIISFKYNRFNSKLKWKYSDSNKIILSLQSILIAPLNLLFYLLRSKYTHSYGIRLNMAWALINIFVVYTLCTCHGNNPNYFAYFLAWQKYSDLFFQLGILWDLFTFEYFSVVALNCLSFFYILSDKTRLISYSYSKTLVYGEKKRAFVKMS